MLNKLLYLLVGFTLVLSSCYEDKGTYDYVDDETHKVTITMKIDAKPYIDEPAVFVPKLTFADKTDTLRYSYEYSFPLYGCVCRERNMSYVFDKPEIGRVMNGLFVVTDTVTSARYYYNVSVTYLSPYAKGWMILSDMGGKSVLNLVRAQQNSYETIPDLYGKLKGKELGTQPYGLSLNYMGMSTSQPKQLRIFQYGGAGSLLLDCNSYSEVSTVSEEFAGGAPVGFKPVNAAFSIAAGWMLGDNGKLYSVAYKRNKLWDAQFVNVAADFKDGLDVQYLLFDSPKRALYDLVIYDRLKGRFLMVFGASSPGGEIFSIIPAAGLSAEIPSPSALKDFSNHYSALYEAAYYSTKCLSVLTDGSGAVCLYGFTLDTKKKVAKDIFLNRNFSAASLIMPGQSKFYLLGRRPYLFFTGGVNQEILYCYDTKANSCYSYKNFGKRIVSLKANYGDGDQTFGVGLEDGEFWLVDIGDPILVAKSNSTLYNTKVSGKIVDILYKSE